MATKSHEPVIGDGSLHIGDRVVYPNQGICRITGVDIKQIAGQNWEVVTLSREEDGATVMVPKAKVMGIGLRKVADVAAIDRVFDELATPNTDPQLDWKVRHRENADRMHGGGLFGTVKVLKGLHAVHADRKSTRLNSSHTEIYTLSLHDALPISQLDWKVRHRENADRMHGGGLFGTVKVLKGLHAVH